jgi:hypothetical protein
MACKRCVLHKACEQIKMPFCPWIFYVGLLILVAIPGIILWQGKELLNL